MKTTYSINITQTDDQGQPSGSLSMTTTDQSDLLRLLKNAGIGSKEGEEGEWSDDPADQGVCPVCGKKPCECDHGEQEVDEEYANEPNPEVVDTPDTQFAEKRPQAPQRKVTARQGDNPMMSESELSSLAENLEKDFIKEWLANSDKSVFDSIKELIERNQEQLKMPTFPVECPSCKAKANLSLDLDQSNFFV